MKSQVCGTENPIDTVADELLDAYRALSRQSYRFLRQLREFDLHRGYEQPGPAGRPAPNTPTWLHRACGIDQDVTREQLRVAYALLNLPRMEDACERGELSSRKVALLSAVANAGNEAALLDFALVMTDSQVDDYCRRLSESAAEGSTSPPPP